MSYIICADVIFSAIRSRCLTGLEPGTFTFVTETPHPGGRRVEFLRIAGDPVVRLGRRNPMPNDSFFMTATCPKWLVGLSQGPSNAGFHGDILYPGRVAPEHVRDSLLGNSSNAVHRLAAIIDTMMCGCQSVDIPHRLDEPRQRRGSIRTSMLDRLGVIHSRRRARRANARLERENRVRTVVAQRDGEVADPSPLVQEANNVPPARSRSSSRSAWVEVAYEAIRRYSEQTAQQPAQWRQLYAAMQANAMNYGNWGNWFVQQTPRAVVRGET